MNQNYGLKLPERVIKKDTVFSMLEIKSGLFSKKIWIKKMDMNLR